MTSIMTPAEIVSELDKFIIGQNNAKKSVAIALRNRWRRQQVAEPMRTEITPKNILMIGPTGVGKTEIARRLAKLANAPFIKVEATKFTEVGYVGKDVDTIIRDLIDIAVKEERKIAIKKKKVLAESRAEEKILDILLPTKDNLTSSIDISADLDSQPDLNSKEKNSTRQLLRKQFREGRFDDKEITIEVKVSTPKTEGIFVPPGMEDTLEQLKDLFGGALHKTTKQTLPVSQAYKILMEQEAGLLINEEEIKAQALHNVEQNGIVFLDEIDKIVARGNSNAEVSRQGVQRDLLPLVEGTTVTTKYGMVNTDHILFIASGAFHLSKPSDLIPELQGRFPIRVELNSLSIDDFKAILTEPDSSLIKQYTALLQTEKINLHFDEYAIQKIAEISYLVNESIENIGARRLYTVMEKLLEEISFNAPNLLEKDININVEQVDLYLKDLSQNQDLSRYIL